MGIAFGEVPGLTFIYYHVYYYIYYILLSLSYYIYIYIIFITFGGVPGLGFARGLLVPTGRAGRRPRRQSPRSEGRRPRPEVDLRTGPRVTRITSLLLSVVVL